MRSRRAGDRAPGTIPGCETPSCPEQQSNYARVLERPEHAVGWRRCCPRGGAWRSDWRPSPVWRWCGRAPHGYVVVDAGPHPNPRKAVEGYRLRVLAIEEASAEVVRRIFAEYLDGRGDRAIAHGLNRDGVQCPSARRPDQNRHRLADGCRAALSDGSWATPRYTGYAVFGRYVKHEMLLNPDDVAAGHPGRARSGGCGPGRVLTRPGRSGSARPGQLASAGRGPRPCTSLGRS